MTHYNAKVLYADGRGLEFSINIVPPMTSDSFRKRALEQEGVVNCIVMATDSPMTRIRYLIPPQAWTSLQEFRSLP